MEDNGTVLIERLGWPLAAMGLDEQRTRNYALRLVAMVEDGDVAVEDFVVVLREHAAGPPPVS